MLVSRNFLWGKLRSKSTTFKLFCFFFSSELLKFILFAFVLFFNTSFDFLWIKTFSWVWEMIFFLYTHKILLRNQNVSTLLLLIVELLNQLAIGFCKISFFFRIMRIISNLLPFLRKFWISMINTKISISWVVFLIPRRTLECLWKDWLLGRPLDWSWPLILTLTESCCLKMLTWERVLVWRSPSNIKLCRLLKCTYKIDYLLILCLLVIVAPLAADICTG